MTTCVKLPLEMLKKTLDLGRRGLESRVRNTEQLLGMVEPSHRETVQDLVQLAQLTLETYNQAADLTLDSCERLDTAPPSRKQGRVNEH